MKHHISIAIDGPAAAGKSTIAKIVAKRLGFTYIDTGAMYRCVTYFALLKNIDPQNQKEVVALLDNMDIILNPNGTVMCNELDVTTEIRSQEVTRNVSYVAAMKEVRLHLVEQQRKMASRKSVVMDGRDIGTYVLPNADVKIFQIASVEERAKRRYAENVEKGIKCELKEIEEDLKKRDYIDSNREFAPLKPAPDAIILDTSYMTIDEVANEVLQISQLNIGGK